MNDLIAVIIFIVFLGVLFFINGLYMNFMAKVEQNNIKKKIAKGKIKDKKLIYLYKMSDRNRNNKILAFLAYGIFYRSFLKLNEAKYLLYKEEVERRGLMNQI
ncbi:hypothetical protein [Lacrimispora defluvii]|uniref:Uncharacterized protein n=1 Tax=Lacrimispora defluvii TaxID=2719233 RepID=A0ABX1VZV2_9FIRM|nr:hypothetical protein [Lacrimispora defluvii]NNJ33319.1 hypothetical protein [Lacrimispora defluvii]